MGSDTVLLHALLHSPTTYLNASSNAAACTSRWIAAFEQLAAQEEALKNTRFSTGVF